MWRGPTTLARLATGAVAMVAVVILSLIPPSPFCIQLNVAASNEKSSLLAILAKDYEAGRPTVDGRCIAVKVSRVPSGEAEAALARGWDEVSDRAPTPDVWSPAATTWVSLLEFHRNASGLPKIVPAARPTIIQSPLVIAMQKPMAEAMGWGTKEIGLSDIFELAQDPKGWARYGHEEWKGFKLGKTSPLSSTSGLHALIATYYAGGGRGDGSPLDTSTLSFMRTVENSVVHYGDTVATHLKELLACDARRQSDQCVSAIAVEEKQVWDYNRGNPASDVPAPRGVLPIVPLVAIYPRDGTIFANHPYVVLTQDAVKQRAAEGFLQYLLGPEAQARFQSVAFRGANGDPGPEITKDNYLDSRPTKIYPTPVPSVVSSIQASWKTIRKPARVLLVIDVAASMADRAPEASKSKLEVAKEAASGALDGFIAGDDVGLWSFSSASGADSPYHEVVPLGPISQQKSILKHGIEELQPQGPHKALYRTLDAAVAWMRARYDAARINAVVVLTDGGNDDPAGNNSLNELQRTLVAQSNDRFVRVFTVGFGSKADLSTLEDIALAGRGGAYSDKDRRAMDRILVAVISNF